MKLSDGDKKYNRVIVAQNKEDPKNPDVYVDGVAVYELNQVKHNVHDKLEDLVRIVNSNDEMKWRKLATLVAHPVLREMLKTIVSAELEIIDNESDN